MEHRSVNVAVGRFKRQAGFGWQAVLTWVSIMERHSPNTRALIHQERYENETFVAINGPDVVHCDLLVKESIADYWRQFLRVGDRGGHFVRRSDNVINWTVSKAIDTLVKKAPKLPFLAK